MHSPLPVVRKKRAPLAAVPAALITYPNGAIYQYVYGKNEKISDIINPLGITIIHNEFDEQDRTISQTFPDGSIAEIEYEDPKSLVVNYDQNDNRTHIFDPFGSVTQIKYNKYNVIGKIEEIINPSGNSTKFTYDLMQNVTSVTDPGGNTINYVYDQYHRIIQTIDEMGNITHYTHDSNDNVISVRTNASNYFQHHILI